MKTTMGLLAITLGLTLGGFFQVDEAAAGCRINIKGRNDSSAPVYLSYHNSKVKVKGGTWKKIFDTDDNLRIEANSTFEYLYKASMGCNVKRRWLFTLTNGGVCEFEYAWYKPSSTGWFAKGTTDISVHELSEKCTR